MIYQEEKKRITFKRKLDKAGNFKTENKNSF